MGRSPTPTPKGTKRFWKDKKQKYGTVVEIPFMIEELLKSAITGKLVKTSSMS